jgi:LysR family transcriptional regulator, glycine cleavage system transcriptional activator
MPVVRLPSMDLIRSFVTVGRRMSITLAAEDMYVTQSAVSRQMHALEEMLGVKLLVRGHRSISFTPEGERLFQVADAAIRQLQDVVESVSASRDRRPVTVTAPTGFVALWLLPRIGHFQQHHTDIDLRISANNRMVDLRNEGIDLAIRYCPRSSASQSAMRLFAETIAPVAHPALRREPLERPDQISEYFLLEFDDLRPQHLHWDNWLGAVGWSRAKPKGLVRFNQYEQVIQAALAGQGIALGRLELLGPIMAERRLVVLSTPRAAEPDYAHWLIQADTDAREDVLDVVNWIHQQVAEMPLAKPSASAPAAGG